MHDAVLVVPSFYTQPERQALLDAAEIADMKVSPSLPPSLPPSLQSSANSFSTGRWLL